MSRAFVLICLACVIGCGTRPEAASSSSPSPTTSLSPTPSPPPSPSPSASPSPSPAAQTFAIVCGTISDYVSDSLSADGSFVLNAPGRDPLKFTIPAGRLGGGAAGYVCIAVRRGSPAPLFDGFVPGGATGFIPSGTVPLTSASPAPIGFVLPQACAFLAPPVVSTAQTDWSVGCGPTRDRDARGTFATELARQGWTLCASGLASAEWRKNGVALVVSESSLAPGDFPRIAQRTGVSSSCP